MGEVVNLNKARKKHNRARPTLPKEPSQAAARAEKAKGWTIAALVEDRPPGGGLNP